MTNDNYPTSGSVLGLGNDIIEIERIRQSIHTYGSRFLSRIFTIKEQQYCLKNKDPAPAFAARFSAKEAVVKALGTGIGKHVSWKDIEILNDSKGKPVVYFSEELLKKFPNTSVIVSFSHSQFYATAVAIWMSSITK